MGILLFFILLFALFQIPAVQSFLAQKAAAYYSEQIGSKIEIEALEIQFFNKIQLKGLYLEDLNQDSLLYADGMLLQIPYFNWEKKSLSIDLHLEGLMASVDRQQGKPEFNYQPYIDYFAPEEETAPLAWKLTIKSIIVEDANFRLHDHHYPDTLEEAMDYSHFDLNQLNLELEDINFKEDTIQAMINRLSAQEKKGFSLDNFSTEMMIHDEAMYFKSLNLQTKLTDICGELSFDYDSLADFSHFVHQVNFSLQLQSSLLHSHDLAFFVPALQSWKQSVYVDGKIEGKVDKLSASDMEIHFNRHTYLLGDLDIRGLPEIEQAFIHLKLEEIQTTAEGLRELSLPGEETHNKITVPPAFDVFGKLFFSGNFTGFYNDFVAYGRLKSDLGSVKLDMSLKESPEKKRMHYQGNIATSNFQLGRLLGEDDLGNLSMNLKLNGFGFSADELKAKAEGEIQSMEYRDYNYRNIQLNGAFQKERFKGRIAMMDQNLDFEFLGALDLSDAHPEADFSLNLRKAKLANLNLFNQKDDSTEISFKAFLNTEGKKIDDISGRLSLDSMVYRDSEKKACIENFAIENKFNHGQRKLSITSSILDASLIGKFNLTNLPQDIERTFNQALSEHGDKKKKSTAARQDFDFMIDIKNSDPFTRVLLPEIEMDSSLQFQGNYRQAEKKLSLSTTGKRFAYSGMVILGSSLDFQLDHDSAKVSFSSDQLNAPMNINLSDVFLTANLKDADLSTTFGWLGVNGRKDSAKFTLLNHFFSPEKFRMQIKNSYLSIRNERWDITDQNQLLFDTSGITVETFQAENGEQSIKINGAWSNLPSDTLDLTIRSLNLNFLESFMPDTALKIQGIADGELHASQAGEGVFLLSNLNFDSLIVNQFDFKSAFIRSFWIQEDTALQLQAKIGEGSSQAFEAKGLIYPLKKEESLALKVFFREFPLFFFNPFLEGVLSEMQGNLDGNFDLNGSFSKPLLSGELALQKAKFKVDYLNTVYSTDHTIMISKDRIGFENMEVIDKNGSKALAKGSLQHSNFSDFKFDIRLDFKDFLTLNTTAKDNELFYGKGVASGNAVIKGEGDQLIFDLNLTAGKGTDFNIPVGDEVEVSNTDFIIFTNKDSLKEDSTKAIDLEGIEMNFNLDIEPQAKVQIIFDEQVGDILKAEGTGNLKLEINTLGNFNIYGSYEVQKGSYLFTLQNIINKRFKIEKGSKISWDGDPLRARLDMKAIYETRAPLQDLFPTDSSANFRRRIPVNVELNMKGLMLQPDITFNIELPTADDNTKERLNSILYLNNNEVNRQEMNQQVFGLLVLNRFMPSNSSSSGNYAAGSSGMNSGYEMISNQLSNWMSNVSEQFDVGVSYRPSNEVSNEELDVSVSTELLDNRLILDGNFGYSENRFQEDNQASSNFIGEFTVEYKLSRDGRLRLKAFNRSTNNSLLQVNSPYTQGAGIFYREEFETFNQLWRKYFGNKPKESEVEPEEKRKEED